MTSRRIGEFESRYLEPILLGNGRWNRLIAHLQTFEIAFDRFLNIRESLRPARTLGNAARQTGNFGNAHSVFVLFNEHAIFHLVRLTLLLGRHVSWRQRRT